MTKHQINASILPTLLGNIEKNLLLDKKKPVDATAWFLGPKAENGKALHKLITMAVQSQIDVRLEYMPDDPPIFHEASSGHAKSIDIIECELRSLLKQLRGGIPLASYRNQSHMYWDITLPGTVGYFAAMLYNQNNVAAEASPVTTLLEVQVGKDLCEMLGFKNSANEKKSTETEIISWGHITCDGSIANGESMWAARNLKYLPIAMATAISTEPDLDAAKGVTVKVLPHGRARLIDASVWQLLNLPIDEVIGLIARIEQVSAIDNAIIRQAVDKYSLQNTGLVEFQQRYLETYTQASPVIFVPATAHYSWPKTAALLGLGTQAVKLIEVDLNGRMSMVALRKALDKCLEKGQPVLQVVAVMGSTEEGAVDPLQEIVHLREEYQQMGLNFVIHADAAWGGYFTSILRKSGLLGNDRAITIDSHPQLFISDHFTRHFTALKHVDSVTLDPHKSGFIPYPAGSLCYRNGAMRDLIAYTAPVVFHGGTDITVGPYGIEGSKPGAAAASVYLSHKVIPLNKTGYGRILGRCIFNNKRFYAALLSMDLPQKHNDKTQQAIFTITPFQRLPTEKQGGTHHEIIQQKKYLKKCIVPYSTDELINSQFGLEKPEEERTENERQALKIFKSIGSDLSIVSYAFNFRTNTGLNTDLKLMNELNENVFRVLSLQPSQAGKISEVELFITSSSLDPAAYGHALTDNFANRAGVKPEKKTAINFLISTTQNPWLSSTADNNMIDPLIKVLIKTVNAEVHKLIEKYELNKN
jgi:glutamate/tyrosine decarboxylase-like PLP-dependent enzyme